ncbi:2-C-methyl-D-erythritol 4-phosphate cytidylyltransferase [Betaproteobacteria bacterium]|nr:2-C-methyl-D-erythritol 4-phosphate cytidylyltransferase [Betaproteobacteria bacterium]GHU43253.1 2-C-methyl-D-erythritol 4-phosphate cytidylyltransferase [Betaproteobacteria bacterium]
MAQCYAIIPAAGSGSRLGDKIPKQYLNIMGKPLLWHVLNVFCRAPQIARVWVVLSPDDAFWSACQTLCQAFGDRLEVLRCGGASRAESVGNALAAVGDTILADDWALVHDAARPCLAPATLARLVATLANDAVGGLLATPLADTLKRGEASNGKVQVQKTLPRAGLWQAQTPQMFRYGLLKAALTAHSDVTDEAGAMEAAGFSPRLVESDVSNLKVTYPADLALAEWILRGREESRQTT